MSPPDTRDFPLAPLARRTTWFLPALWLLIVAVAYLTPPAQPAATEPVPAWLITPFACALLLIGPFILLQYRRIRVEDGALHVMAASVFTRTTAIQDLDLQQARIVNLDEHREYRPWLRLFGMSLPGFTAGHCLLRNRARAFCLLSDRERVLVLPQRDGRYLLLSPERPQALLSQLRELAGTPHRH